MFAKVKYGHFDIFEWHPYAETLPNCFLLSFYKMMILSQSTYIIYLLKTMPEIFYTQTFFYFH